MSKAEDLKFLKIQTWVLKVNIHCEGCKRKVKKLLQKIDGVYTTVIDAEQGKVTVSGTVDPSTIIKKLSKGGKHAELWASKGNNKNSINNPNPKSGNETPHQKPHNSSEGKDQKLQKQLMDMKLVMDTKLPHMKDEKSVKFSLPHNDPDDDGSDLDDDLDDDDYLDETTDGSDDDIDGYDKIDVKGMSLPTKGMVTEKKGGGGKNGGGGTQLEAKNGNNINNKNSSNNNNSKGAPNGNGHQKQSGGVANGVKKHEMTISNGMVGNPTTVGGAVNPYQQQQYLAEMMQQQQRMMMNGYPVAYGYPMAHPNIYASYFSDENTGSSCSIM